MFLGSLQVLGLPTCSPKWPYWNYCSSRRSCSKNTSSMQNHTVHTSKGNLKKNATANELLKHNLQTVSGVRCIHRLNHDECLRNDTKESDSEPPVMVEVWGMRSTPSLPSLPGPLWPRVVAPDRVLSMDQIKLNWVLILNWITWNRTALTFNCVWTKTILILN